MTPPLAGQEDSGQARMTQGADRQDDRILGVARMTEGKNI